ncbi:MAG TPA: di-heme oxidoredictase family protein [Blastocatellia bacterium]|jgi:CxxC motif-containing protein (DUF1111 family)|nr:di-heme oxidoredictase family protein [Blastocatellia bacterium]
MKKLLKVSALVCFVAALVLSMAVTSSVQSQAATEAPTGFDNQTNGFIPQGTVVAEPPIGGNFVNDRAIFEEREFIADGLGPVYNAQACAECHQSPVTGGISQINEFRAGHNDAFGNFIDAPGGSLINDRAINASIVERISTAENVRTFRTSLNLLGDGFVEAIANGTMTNIQAGQPAAQRGTIINVPVLEAGGALRIGRFGWKNQQASLVSFSADAYLNEMGITSPLQPTENTSNGNSVAPFDTVADPEDDGDDVETFAEFMRATKAPPRGPITADVTAGSSLFDSIGCAVCHVRSITTAPAGTSINQGAFIVPAALGNKIIHPFGDFLLHDVGTGDGIVQNGGQGTKNMVRTAPLWGVRTRNKLMHDGQTSTFNDAILRHAGQANTAANNYRNLTDTNKNRLISFLLSL